MFGLFKKKDKIKPVEITAGWIFGRHGVDLAE